MKNKLIDEPITIFRLRLANHASAATIRIKSGQGVAKSSFSSQIRNCSSGSKKTLYVLTVGSSEILKALINRLSKITHITTTKLWEFS